MTGYGRKEIESGTIRITLEVRSVNNRFMDVQIKSPRSFSALEPRIRKTVQDSCSRGRFDVFISRAGDRETAGRIVVDDSLMNQYIESIRGIKKRYELSGDVDLALVIRFPGLISLAEEKEDTEELWSNISRGLREALDELDWMRVEEGTALVSDMSGRLNTIEGLMQSVQTLSPTDRGTGAEKNV